jgi:hypothetical protein
MTYSSGGLIQASDYNTFAGNTTAGLNRVWSTGSGDAGWGQTTIPLVAAQSGAVSHTNWATLVNNLSTTGAQTTTTLTARTPPVSQTVITVLTNVQTDITNCTTNRGNATSSGAEVGYASGTTSKTTATGAGQAAWTIVFTHTVTFPSADQARYFWNAGGLVRLQFGKSSGTSTTIDADWNTFAGYPGSIYVTGRVNGAAQTIAGVSYTGTTRIGGTGGTQTTLATTTGWYNLTGTPASIFLLNNSNAPYTNESIGTTAAASATVLTLVTTWTQPAIATPGSNTVIEGGTAPALGATSIGAATAPTTLCTFFPPSTAQGLSNTWGTPVIAASVV